MKTYIVDSFTNEKFKGNPAGVCLTDQPLSEELMQNIAKELNFSETAYVRKLEEDNHYAIRYFSPKMEIPLCGHATLASAKVLFEKHNLSEIHFHTIEDIDLHITNTNDRIIMKFPIYELEDAEVPQLLLKALGLDGFIDCGYNREANILLIEIESADVLKNLTPDFNAILSAHDSISGVSVTAKGNDGYDFHSRYFWPRSGSNEDPVTGGTHTFLAKYWSQKLGKTKMKSFQSSARTGFMDVELLNDKEMLILGSAIIVLEGEMRM